jgi:hypothetical protein
LLLAGCGGGDGGGSGGDKIDGAEGAKGAKSSPDKEKGKGGAKDEAGDFRTSDIKLPDDVKLVFDWKQPSDPDKAAALDGAADYMRAQMHAVAKQDPKDPVLADATVPLQSAQEYVSSIVEGTSKKGYSVTGTERYYKEHVGDVTDGKLVEVSYCANQAKIFNKVAKTGKVIRTAPSDNSYLHFELVMQKSSKADEPWKARAANVTGKAVEQCAE